MGKEKTCFSARQSKALIKEFEGKYEDMMMEAGDEFGHEGSKSDKVMQEAFDISLERVADNNKVSQDKLYKLLTSIDEWKGYD